MQATPSSATDLISIPIDTQRTPVQASMCSPMVHLCENEQDCQQTYPGIDLEAINMYDQPTIKPNPFWFSDFQISKKLVDVGEYLHIHDRINYVNCNKGTS